MEYDLAKLERITNLREVWNHEARDFTCWLAKEENLAMLSDVIGVPIELKERESSVGSFNVDLFAMVADTEPERKIIIENQLEDTNHDHLGKIITYASGKDAEILIWIVKRAREEHRQAVEWLNQHTDTSVSVFLIEIELWRIDNSRMAPKFNIVVKPNDWAKAMRSNDSSSASQLFNMDFWEEFKSYAENDKSFIQSFPRLRKPSQQNSYDMTFGDNELWVFSKYDTRKNRITCGLYIPKSKERYDSIKKHEQMIAQYFSHDIQFDEKEGRQGTYITISKDDVDVNNTKQRHSIFQWICENAVRWRKVLEEIDKGA